MKTVIFITLMLTSPVIFSEEAQGLLIATAPDPSGQVKLVTPLGTCSASTPSVGPNLAPVRGQEPLKDSAGKPLSPLQYAPVYAIQYITTPKGGYISANVGYGSFTITAPPGLGWAVTNNSLSVLYNGSSFKLGETVTGTGSRTFTIEQK